MSRLLRHITTTLLVLMPIVTWAQMEIEIEPKSGGGRSPFNSFRDSIRMQSVVHDYFSAARYRHERSLIRKERNPIDVTVALQGSMTNLSESWVETSGGDNTVTLLASVYAKHTFKLNDFSIESALSALFGYYRLVLESTNDDASIERNPVWYKNQDEVQISITPSYKFSENWSYGANVKFRTQFTKGYLSSSSQAEYNLMSAFLSPGYLDISGGLIYYKEKAKNPIKLSLSPIAMSATYVTNETVRENSQYKYLEPTTDNYAYNEPYGVNHNIRSNYEGGSAIQIDYERSFGKKSFLKYTTSLYSFYGWMTQISYKNIYSSISSYDSAIEEWNSTNEGIKPILSLRPTVRWENRVEIKAHRLLSTTVNFQLYYNRAQNYKVQTQTLLSVGLLYNFKTKVK